MKDLRMEKLNIQKMLCAKIVNCYRRCKMMEEIEELKALQEKDVMEAKDKALTKLIGDASRTLASLKNQQNSLQNQLDELNEEMNNIDAENQELSQNYHNPVSYKDSHKKLPFFEQLKIIEAQTDFFNAQISSFKQNINVLTKDLTSNVATHKRLTQKAADLEKDLNTLITTEQERIGTKTKLHTEITNKNDELNRLINMCEVIKADMIIQTREMKDITPEAMSLLLIQKDALTKELRKKKDELRKLEVKVQEKASKQTAMENLQKKKLAQTASPMKWYSERTALLAKVKKAREELAELRNRERSASRQKAKAAAKKEQLSYTEDDVRRAIALEIRELQNSRDRFIDDALAVEETFKADATAEDEQIERTLAQIREFRERNMTVLQHEDEKMARADRLELLRQEANEIRSKL